MAPSIVAEVAPPVVDVAVTHTTATAELVELVLADEELLEAEFEAIVAAGWGGHAPRWPTSRGGGWWPREPLADPEGRRRRGPRDLLTAYAGMAYERGPPRS